MTSITGSATDLSEAATNNALWQISMFLSSSSIVLYKLASERQDNFKDFLLINGMTKAAYQAKIAASCYIEILFAAIIQALTIYFNYHQAFSSSYVILEIMLILLISGIATMNMCFFLSQFLSPKTASAAGSFLLFLLGLLYFVGTSFSSLSVYLLASLQPNAGLALALNSLFPTQNGGGLTGTQINWDGYSSVKGSIMMIISGVVYLGLYLYMERDKDVDYKAMERLKLKKAKESYISLSLLQNSMNSTKAEIEDTEAAIEVQPQSRNVLLSNFEKLPDNLKLKKTIETVNLKKVYKDCIAVENVSLSVYEQEIFCLLGHNGAGKTTLVNVLTGLIPKTDGTFYYNGEEIFLNLEKIRGNIGFCPQKDFLLMHNSVYENLKFFAEIKKISAVRMESEIERVMTQLGLLYFKDMPAQSLSGGFKRKLSIGIALINNPKIIIMDEPTSGMDPVSRRSFWDIIKELKKENKTVIFTTQILDEAEVLADRVAIMSKGNLFAMGTPDFIKKKFGSGYTLSLNDNQNSMEILSKGMDITQRVHRVIPNAIRNYDAPPNLLEFTLPFSEQKRFSELFSDLENINDIQMNLRMTTLEEVFVGLELDEDRVEGKEISDNATLESQNIPAGFFRDKNPSFVDLLMAVIIQKKYNALKNKSLLLVTWLPTLFMIGGIGLSSRLTDQKAGAQNIILILLFGNSFMMNSFTTPPATERLYKISHMLKAMGLRSVPYWIGNLISDFMIKGIECVLLITCVFLFNVSYLKENIGSFALLYFAFSFNMITKAYNISMEYKTLTAIVSAGPFYLIGGTLLPQFMNSILYTFFQMNALGALYIISAILLGPAVLLQLGFHTLLPSDIDDESFSKNMPFQQIWVYITLAMVLGIVELLRVLWADSKAFELKESIIYPQNDPPIQMPIDHVAISYEKTRVISEENDDPIKAIDVQKIYPNGFKALDDLTFGVERGQIFCLLGPNGAGKTTAFDILTSKIPKSSGTVKLEGKELSRGLYDVFNETGICPQSNTLWESLTVEEHLKIYAHIKGLSHTEKKEYIPYLLEAVGLVEYRNRPAEKLSGGNKRKLCVAISVIGAPKLMFMDEPSTGMDPLARSKLWGLIKNVMRGKRGTMVLTTHFMQEAELVGNKLGMLINGRFAIMGTLGELKKKFGEYTIAIQEIENGFSAMQIEILIQSVVARSRRHMAPEEKGILFKVPCDAMKFSGVFQMLEEMKSTKQIKDFSIYTTTLEQIFIKLAKLQRRRE